MRFRTAILLALCLLPGGSPVAAQLGLPQVRLPDAARTLPTLPDVNADPLIAATDRLTQIRLDRIASLVERNRDSIELDERGEPAVRGVLVASGVDVVRISPQSQHTAQIVGLFDAVRRGIATPRAAQEQLRALLPGEPCNGYWHGRSGLEQVSEVTA